MIVILPSSSTYPILLKEIPDPPQKLFIMGDPRTLISQKIIAVVGTRQITRYGTRVTKKIVRGLVAKGYTIVSGLAYGVDAVAHQEAINEGGKTIAVLGCGIDIIAPPGNTELYWRIVREGGAIVSEMPLGFRPNKKLFITRNRIISGLSLGVVVTEGTRFSGSLITANYAAEQGRDVFAVPGPVTSIYSGAASFLLKNGAKLVESADDILEEL